MNEKAKIGVARIAAASRYSWQGLKRAWKDEAAFRQESALLVLATVVSLLLNLSGGQRLLLLAAGVAVLVVELLNSAIEAAIDRIGGKYHDLSKKAKDTGSAAVLLALIAYAALWLSVLMDIGAF